MYRGPAGFSKHAVFFCTPRMSDPVGGSGRDLWKSGFPFINSLKERMLKG
jgi:hypothetical protein